MSDIREWGFWTEQKLDILNDYLRGFLSASKKAPHRIYIDAYAGQGEARSKHDQAPIQTSPQIAKDVRDSNDQRGFEQLIYVELEHAEQLRTNVKAEDDSRIEVYEGDCHEQLPKILKQLRKSNGSHVYWPVVVFLDPYGIRDLKWKTIQAVAEFKKGMRGDGRPVRKAEQYILFSDTGLARTLRQDLAQTSASELQAATEAFGSEDWKALHALYAKDALSFDEFRAELVNLMRWRLQQVLGYRYTHVLPLVNGKNRDLYHMIFATDDDQGSKIIKHVYQAHAKKIPALRRAAKDRNIGQQSLGFADSLFEEVSLPRYVYEEPYDPFSLA